jgi:hypothetical protein
MSRWPTWTLACRYATLRRGERKIGYLDELSEGGNGKWPNGKANGKLAIFKELACGEKAEGLL